MEKIFEKAQINVEHDLLGAARASCGKEAGLSGILGTGSNCCVYDGNNIIKDYRTGGYILGDEGGGVHMGKSVLKSFIEDKMPKDVREKFDAIYHTNVDEILENIYKKPLPNRYIAKFSQFAFQNREMVFLQKVILDSLISFFDSQVLRFEQAKTLPLNLIGSIAFHYQDYIREIAKTKNVRIGNILEKPISALVLYHHELS